MEDLIDIDTEIPHPCNCGETHKGHICWLSQMGLFREMQHPTDTPTVKCAKCGAKANLQHNVCFPETLEK